MHTGTNLVVIPYDYPEFVADVTSQAKRGLIKMNRDQIELARRSTAIDEDDTSEFRRLSRHAYMHTCREIN